MTTRPRYTFRGVRPDSSASASIIPFPLRAAAPEVSTEDHPQYGDGLLAKRPEFGGARFDKVEMDGPFRDREWGARGPNYGFWVCVGLALGGVGYWVMRHG
jgi:hypothetical protein